MIKNIKLIVKNQYEFLHIDLDYFGEYDVNYKLSPEVIAEISKTIVFLKLANIYTHRIDYLLSGDDGEESFFERIEEDLNKYKDEDNNCD